ncbi:tRNA lysidine(34) synthetase TilS [Nocardioides marmoriginsengisoli]|uniref:tRNA(Ile)-lysidine synthase n=2 Tax=Nocardioides marmoriginsengisoli TaxID=661483 RepID=A0A3N0CFH3_9ACTN|nr:tRNA lysidine(34) synthetase TilS [Nocardioides marmoriginsengisoli]
MGLDPAVAAVRLAVRRNLTILNDGEGGYWAPDLGSSVMVACSGGADSLALLAATIFEVAKLKETRVIGVVVDHGLQEGSAEHTARVVEQMAALGADETATIRVTVDPGPAGIEAGAREARYAALSQLAEHFSTELVLLGHTLDDQAENVLLGLARGSGGRSLQGMRHGFRRDEGEPVLEPIASRTEETPDGPRTLYLGHEVFRHSTAFSRPLLGITRAQTEAACRAEDIVWWEDPHNADPRFLRSRVRHSVLPVLERELGPGVAQALARTAEQLRLDMDELDLHAEAALEEARIEGGIDADDLEYTSPAIFGRVLRLAAIEAGAIPSELTYEHVQAIRGTRPGKEIQLPGHVTAYREGESRILFKPTPPLPD